MANSWNRIILYKRKNLETLSSHLGQSTNEALTPITCHLVKFKSVIVIESFNVIFLHLGELLSYLFEDEN